MGFGLGVDTVVGLTVFCYSGFNKNIVFLENFLVFFVVFGQVLKNTLEFVRRFDETSVQRLGGFVQIQYGVQVFLIVETFEVKIVAKFELVFSLY